ncbi:response regulator [Brevibacillus ruminantium]|uniref:Response regulator n=1 Tax=Brevibacillus ruminantium TaxID=2950604 RepID=A0ABY4WEQ2_9BACL|nr:response regulator [Brevibacillus ruminantium]USG65625.1 response regulator [Brevibacillus ruminantium]
MNARKSIMIVDDAVLIRYMMSNMIQSLGFGIAAEAMSGEDAVRKYRLYRPELVLMDIAMPGMDGLSAVQKIIEFDREAKIIICSAVAQREVVIKAIHAGAQDFIAKPLQMERIEWSIRKVLGT